MRAERPSDKPETILVTLNEWESTRLVGPKRASYDDGLKARILDDAVELCQDMLIASGYLRGHIVSSSKLGSVPIMDVIIRREIELKPHSKW